MGISNCSQQLVDPNFPSLLLREGLDMLDHGGVECLGSISSRTAKGCDSENPTQVISISMSLCSGE